MYVYIFTSKHILDNVYACLPIHIIYSEHPNMFAFHQDNSGNQTSEQVTNHAHK